MNETRVCKDFNIRPSLAASFAERELKFSATRDRFIQDRPLKQNIMLEALAAFFVYTAESFTGSVIENSSASTCRQDQEDINNSDIQEVERLLPETDALNDLSLIPTRLATQYFRSLILRMEVAVVCCGNSPGLPRGSSLYCVSKGCLRCSCYWVLALPYSRLLLWF